MFYKGANCDIYIGKDAGKKLLADIRNARKSIRVVSPYLSPFLISELINFRKRNLEVELITTDDIEDFYRGNEKNIHKLIIQNRKVTHLDNILGEVTHYRTGRSVQVITGHHVHRPRWVLTMARAFFCPLRVRP